MVCHQMKYDSLQKVILVLNFHEPMFLDVRYTCSMLLFRMGRKYLRGVLVCGLAFFLGSQMCILLKFRWC